MARWLVISLEVLGAIVAVALVFLLSQLGLLKTGRALKIGQIDLASMADGTYRGTYQLSRWTNTAEVDVVDHRITGVRYVKEPTAQATLSKQVAAKVVERQSLAIDTVSGATVSTKAYLKSIENALSQPGTR